MRSLTALYLGFCILTAATAAWAGAGPKTSGVSYVRDVAPILQRRCVACHGERSNQGSLRLHTYESLRRPGATGVSTLVSGKPGASELLRRITDANPARRMPRFDEPLGAADVAMLRRWIEEGAKFDGSDPKADTRALAGPRAHPRPPVSYRAPAPVYALAFTPDGALLLTGGSNEVLVWEAGTGALARRIDRLPLRIQSLSFAPDGRSLLVCGGTPGEYGEATLVDWPAAGTRRVLGTYPDLALAGAIGRTGQRAVVGGADGIVRAYSLPGGRLRWQSRVHSDWVTSVAEDPSGHFIASAGKDHTVKVHSAATGELFTTYQGHNRQIGQYRGQHPVFAVRFGPDGTAWSGGGGRWLQNWDPVKTRTEGGDAGDMEERFARQGHARYLPHGMTGDVFAVVTAGRQLFAAATDGGVRRYDGQRLAGTGSFPGLSDWLFSLDYAAASDRLAAGGYRGEVRIWNAASGDQVCSFRNLPPRPATDGTGRVRRSSPPSPLHPTEQAGPDAVATNAEGRATPGARSFRTGPPPARESPARAGAVSSPPRALREAERTGP
jgi:mono/diheme cytochrome c family protein